PFPESVSEEREIDTDYDGCHRQHVEHYADLFDHLSTLGRSSHSTPKPKGPQEHGKTLGFPECRLLDPSYRRQYSSPFGKFVAYAYVAQPPLEGSMTIATRIPNRFAKLFFGTMASTSVLALAVAGSHPALAQGHAAAALTGTVSSAQEGKMEGVVVSAKR